MTMMPILYQPEIPDFLNAYDKAVNLDYVIPLKPEQLADKKIEPKKESLEIVTFANILDDEVHEEIPEQKFVQPVVQTGIIQSFYLTLQNADADYERVTKPRLTGKRRYDNPIELDIENFYNDRCDLHANEIVQHIKALVQIDGYDETVFGNWKGIYDAIKMSKGMQKAHYLKQLIIHSKTTIPVNIRIEEVEIVEPAITSQKRTVRG